MVASSVRRPGESRLEGIVLMSDMEQPVMVPHDVIIEYSIIKSKVKRMMYRMIYQTVSCIIH